MDKSENELTITVRSSTPEVLERFKALMTLLDRSGNWGHSGTFGMALDGDGSEQLSIEGVDHDEYRRGVNAVNGVGYDIEIVQADGIFTGRFVDNKRNCRWTYTKGGTE